jgi:PAS domain S-box-containing protein
MEEARCETEEFRPKYQNLLDRDPAAHLTLRGNRIISGVNPAAENLIGIDRASLLNRHFDDVIAEDSREEMTGIVEGADASAAVLRLLRPGRPVYVLAQAVPVQPECGADRETLVTLTDVTELKENEHRLRKAERRNAEAQRLAHVGSWEWDLSNDLVTGSDEFFRIFDLSPAENQVPSGLLLERVLLEDHPEIEAVLKKACLRACSFDCHHRIVRPDGSLRILHTLGNSVSVSDPAPSVMFGACQDVTDLKEAEDALKRSERKFALVFKTAPIALSITSPATGIYLDVNEAFERLTGFERNELIGKKSHDLNIWKNAEDRIGVLRRLENGEKVRHYELSFRKKSGEIIIVQYSAEIIELYGRPSMLNIINDITSRKQAEQRLMESEERLRAVFEHAAVGIGEIAGEGTFIRANPRLCEILGYPEAELQRIPLSDLIHQDDRERSLELFRASMAGRLPQFSQVKRCLSRTGSMIWVKLSATHIAGTDHRPRYNIVVIEDITEMKRSEVEKKRLNLELAARAAELESANRELETFNFTVSHDLRNPLNLISVDCQMLEEKCSEILDDECMTHLSGILENALGMGEMIDTLLNFSRLTHAELSMSRVNLSELAESAAADLRLQNPERSVTVKITPELHAEGDPRLLQVVLTNLISNAWKYTEAQERPVIQFGIIPGPTFFVSDNGAGFDMKHADKLFSPFQRLPGAEKCGGYGIGLATVERIIRRHGGRIWAESVPGKGATFYFNLPHDRDTLPVPV